MPNFQTSEANFSKPRIDKDTMSSLKVAQATFLFKNVSEKLNFVVSHL